MFLFELLLLAWFVIIFLLFWHILHKYRVVLVLWMGTFCLLRIIHPSTVTWLCRVWFLSVDSCSCCGCLTKQALAVLLRSFVRVDCYGKFFQSLINFHSLVAYLVQAVIVLLVHRKLHRCINFHLWVLFLRLKLIFCLKKAQMSLWNLRLLFLYHRGHLWKVNHFWFSLLMPWNPSNLIARVVWVAYSATFVKQRIMQLINIVIPIV